MAAVLHRSPSYKLDIFGFEVHDIESHLARECCPGGDETDMAPANLSFVIYFSPFRWLGDTVNHSKC